MSRTAFLSASLIAASLVSGQAASFALAAPADLARQPDARFDVCDNGLSGKCVVRAAADINGDGMTDIVVQRFGFKHEIIVLMAPFGRTGAAKTSSIKIDTDPGFPSVLVTDVNRDGFGDLAFVARVMHDQEPGRRSDASEMIVHRVAIVLGGRLGLPARDLHAGTNADIVIERTARAHEQPHLRTMELSAAFGDFDADGRLDLALGSGIPGIRQAMGTGHGAGRSPTPGSLESFDASVEIMSGIEVSKGARFLFTPDASYTNLGTCEQSLAGAADLSGDGIDDLVLRQCPGNGLPDQLRVIPGGASDFADHPAPSADSLTSGSLQLGQAGGAPSIDIVPPGRGYLGGRVGGGMPGDPIPLFFTDLDADGIRDIVLPHNRNTHVWLGGADIAERVDASRSDRVFVGAGFGETARSGGWRTGDLTGDGAPDLLLTDVQAAERPGEGGVVTAESRALQPIHVFSGSRAILEVLDLGLDSPDAAWREPGLALWGMADFNGDDVIDLLLGDANASRSSNYSIVFGPLGAR